MADDFEIDVEKEKTNGAIKALISQVQTKLGEGTTEQDVRNMRFGALLHTLYPQGVRFRIVTETMQQRVQDVKMATDYRGPQRLYERS